MRMDGQTPGIPIYILLHLAAGNNKLQIQQHNKQDVARYVMLRIPPLVHL